MHGIATAYFVDLFFLSTFYQRTSEFSHTYLQTPSIFGPFKCRFISRTNAQHNTTQMDLSVDFWSIISLHNS